MMAVKVHVLNQLLAAFTAFLPIFYSGMWRAYTSLVISKLKGTQWHSEEVPIPLTLDGITWMVALPDLGGLLSAFPVACVVDRFGRLTFLRLTFVLFILGSAMILAATSQYLIFSAAFLIGVGRAVGFSISALYVAEIAQATLRGALTNVSVLLVTVATALTFTLGPHVSLDHLTWASLLCGLIGLLLTFTLAETPYFYLIQNKKSPAAKALSRLRNDKKRTKNSKELEAIYENVENTTQGTRTWSKLISDKGNRRALMIVVAKSALRKAGGWNTIILFGPTILPAVSNWSPHLSVEITLWLMFAFSLLGISLVDRLGRKPLQLVATLVLSLITAILAVFFYFFEKTNVNTTLLVSVPHISLILGGVFFPFAETVNIYRGELLSPGIQGLAAAVVLTFEQAISFVLKKFFFAVKENFGMYVMFAMSSAFYFFDFLFTVVYIFETKGKTLADIQIQLES